MNVTIVDYQSGNISSVINSFTEVAKGKVNLEVTSEIKRIKSSDKIVLPGQGSLYISQTLNFVSPAFIDDVVTVSGELTKISSSTGIVRVKTQITTMNNKLLVSGEAKVLIP